MENTTTNNVKKTNQKGATKTVKQNGGKTVRALLSADVSMPESKNNNISIDFCSCQKPDSKICPGGWQARPAGPAGQQAANPASQSDENGTKTM